MEQTVIVPGETTAGPSDCTHPVLDVVDGGWRCTICRVFIRGRAA